MRFGIFEFHSATGQLYRAGVPVRLQAQPAQVLSLLLQHSGQVVTRAQLQQAVWGSETFVDFDKGLNFCIAQVRAALGESADAPVYIETIPKRGYRFIAPVTSSDDNPASAAQNVVVPPAAAWRQKRLWLPALAILMVLSVGLIVWHELDAQHRGVPAVAAATTRVAV